MPTISESKYYDNHVDIEDAPEFEEEKSSNIENSRKKTKCKVKVEEPIMKTIPRPLHPFPKILKKK